MTKVEKIIKTEIKIGKPKKMKPLKNCFQIAMSEKSERGTKAKRREDGSSMGGGEVYQSKKAKGDVKRKNKHDPYSYLPLRKDMLNKRQFGK